MTNENQDAYDAASERASERRTKAVADFDARQAERVAQREDFAVKVGKPLPNGAVVVAAEPNGEYVVVLAVRPPRAPGRYDQYVTWKVDPDSGDAYWGDYFVSFDEAVANFKARVGG